MITQKSFFKLALSFSNTEQVPHFERIGFKVIGKRMFATYLEKDNTANIFLTPAQQSVFCQTDPQNIHQIPNKWGLQGATTFDLNKVSKELVSEALQAAYEEVVTPKPRRSK